MNNLLFTALLIALLYYFLIYLPQKKLNANLPFKHHQETQTENIIEPSAKLVTDEKTELLKEIQQKARTIKSYQQLETKSKKEIEDLKQQISTITHQLKELKDQQNKDDKVLENTLDQLLKGIQDLNTELN